MNVLSLFDGKSSGYTACELAGIEIGTYYSAEVDKYAIEVSKSIHPNQIRLGDISYWRSWDIDWSSIDMIFGGFPCQAWSMAGKQMGDKDERGMLFWVMLDIMKHVRHHNPKADFLIENVKMKKEFEEYITYHMENAVGDVHKILINSALVSAQNRNRYYWTSFPVTQPKDKGIVLADVVDGDIGNGTFFSGDLACFYDANISEISFSNRFDENSQSLRRGLKNVKGLLDKSKCLTACTYKGWAANGATNVLVNKNIRTLTPRECFRLQTVPERYIDKILDCGVSNTQLYKIAGNGWTDEVIAHILKCMED